MATNLAPAPPQLEAYAWPDAVMWWHEPGEPCWHVMRWIAGVPALAAIGCDTLRRGVRLCDGTPVNGADWTYVTPLAARCQACTDIAQALVDAAAQPAAETPKGAP